MISTRFFCPYFYVIADSCFGSQPNQNRREKKIHFAAFYATAYFSFVTHSAHYIIWKCSAMETYKQAVFKWKTYIGLRFCSINNTFSRINTASDQQKPLFIFQTEYILSEEKKSARENSRTQYRSEQNKGSLNTILIHLRHAYSTLTANRLVSWQLLALFFSVFLYPLLHHAFSLYEHKSL